MAVIKHGSVLGDYITNHTANLLSDCKGQKCVYKQNVIDYIFKRLTTIHRDSVEHSVLRAFGRDPISRKQAINEYLLAYTFPELDIVYRKNKPLERESDRLGPLKISHIGYKPIEEVIYAIIERKNKFKGYNVLKRLFRSRD